jgi:hypothetical protein
MCTKPHKYVRGWRCCSIILDLGTKLSSPISFIPQYPLYRMLGEPQNQNDHCGVQKNLLPFPETEPQSSKVHVRLKVFTAVAMKNGVFWGVTPCGSCKNQEPYGVTSQKTPFFIQSASLLCYPGYNLQLVQKQKTISVARSLRENYTDWTTTTFWRNLVPTFVDRGVWRGQHGGSLTVVNLSFLDRSHYFSIK